MHFYTTLNTLIRSHAKPKLSFLQCLFNWYYGNEDLSLSAAPPNAILWSNLVQFYTIFFYAMFAFI